MKLKGEIAAELFYAKKTIRDQEKMIADQKIHEDHILSEFRLVKGDLRASKKKEAIHVAMIEDIAQDSSKKDIQLRHKDVALGNEERSRELLEDTLKTINFLRENSR